LTDNTITKKLKSGLFVKKLLSKTVNGHSVPINCSIVGITIILVTKTEYEATFRSHENS